MLVAPTGGEVWRGTRTIQWQFRGAGWEPGDTVRIEYSSDAGKSWQQIPGAESLSYGDGAFSWDTAGVTKMILDADAGLWLGGVGNFNAGGVRTTHSEANVSSPPTDAELDATFGTPAAVGEGFHALVDDNNANTAGWAVWSLGGSWWYAPALTKAV